MKVKRLADRERLQHVHEASAKIITFCNGHSIETFLESELLQSAVLHQFLVIGETIGHVDENILLKYDYPWHVVRSFRNYIAHEYFGLKMERVWNTTEKEIPALKELIKNILVKEF